MFNLLRGAATRARRRTRAAGVRAASRLLEKFVAPAVSPPKKAPRSVKSAPPKLKDAAVGTAARREGLATTLRRLKAEAMKPGARVVRARGSIPRGASFKLAEYASAQGARSYWLYAPASAATKAATGGRLPLVVMLHGCGQTPEDFATGTRMNALAEEFGLLVAYPEQPTGANANRCWNWFNAEDQRRDAGEPALIAGITRAILRERCADPTRVYVAGLSAGGAAAAIVAAAYPDLFAAAGVHSGLPVGAAHNPASGFLAMRRGAPGDRPTVAMPTIVFHGDADTVVHPRNGRFVAARSLVAFPRLGQVVRPGLSPGGRLYTRTVHRIGRGKPLCEQWVVEGAGHAWAGGHPAGSYTDPAGPDASRAMLAFFLRHRMPVRRRKPAARTGR